jgi:SAM-dependent methyltransferase
MPLERILEPEVMDSSEEASDYDAMDHTAVNRVFVDDLLAALKGSGFGVQGSGHEGQWSEPFAQRSDETDSSHSVLSTQYSVPSTRFDDSLPLGPNTPLAPSPHPLASPEPRTLNPEPSPGTLNPDPPLDVLDLGTGTALIPIELCRKFAGCRVIAADAAVSMLDLARYNIEVYGLIDRIELAHVDAKKLAFTDEMFDVVMSNSIIHHIPEPIHVLREAIRVTRQGGLLFFRDLVRPNDERELQRLVETYTPGDNAHQQKMFAASLHAALSLDEIRSLIVSLGFPPDSIRQTTDRHWTWSARCI